MNNFQEIIENSMINYSGAVLQSRALIDVRDGLKPSARQIFYSMLLHKLIHKNAYKKTANAVGMAMADFYIHGDSSCEGIIMRAGQPFAMRYPLVEVKGNAGTLMASGNWAAMRYTESRLSELSSILFDDIKKDTISDWRDSYDNTKQYPSVLPSKGFYNLCNGTQGIGVGLASSIPQYNIKELNNALIYLIQNPDCDFEDIYCAPDFATGAVLFNESEVKESMKHGTGAACKLRSVIEFDSTQRCFIVTEIPYGTYTNTICKQLEDIINGDNNPGIERFNDLTGEKPLIKIYLSKKATPDRILKFLFKNTSLQSYYGINFTMLDNGKYPRVFTWKEALQAHIDHEKIVYRSGFEFDLNKIKERIHIIEGLLICTARIEEVVQTIKSAKSTSDAAHSLCELYLLDDIQAKAVLDMKLARLAHLEVQKLETEKEKLLVDQVNIEQILNDEQLFNQQLINGWKETSQKFGDARRTKILNLQEEEGEVIEEKSLSLSFTNKNAVFVTDTSTLYTQKRNSVGSKFKLDKGEFIIDNITGKNTDKILFFTSKGTFYPRSMNEFLVGEKQYLDIDEVRAACVVSRDIADKNIIFITKNGILKKSHLQEYNLKRQVGSTALKLDKDDEVVSVLIIKDEQIGILSKNGNFIWIETKDINPIGRIAKGIKGISLTNDIVVSARIIPSNIQELLSITTDGKCKRSSIKEFKITSRATKGSKIQKGESLCDFLPIRDQSDILVISNKSQLRVKINDIPLLSKGTQGVKAIKLSENSKIIALEKI